MRAAASTPPFSYYKDLRSSGGRLKLGYGPGGPPNLGKASFLNLLSQLVAMQCFTKQEIISAVDSLQDGMATQSDR